MKSMRDFNVYTEVPIDQCSQKDIDNVIGVRWVKRWKTDVELRMRLVVQGCFQDSSSIDVDSIYACTHVRTGSCTLQQLWRPFVQGHIFYGFFRAR